MTLFYLASPYSKFPHGREAAFRVACVNAAILIANDVPTFSPIAHSHPIAEYGGLDPLDHSLWLPADKPMMDASSGLIVLLAEGWETSFGMAHEIEAFQKAGKPVIYMKPGVFPAELRKG